MKLYIDPGTGSMLFTILIGIIGAGIYSIRMLWIKLRFGAFKNKSKAQNDVIPFVIFSDDKRYWNIFEPICREMDKRGVEVLYLTASEDDPALSSSYEHISAEFIGSDNKAFTRLNFLKADILLSTTPGLDVYQWKKSKAVKYYVHIPHAAGEILLYRMFGIDYYDAILTSCDFQGRDVRRLEELRGLPEKEIECVGITYMDEMANRLKDAPEIPKHSRTVLLAPSWGESGLLKLYGEELIDSLIKTGYDIIIRPHPQSFKSEKEMLNSLIQKYPESEHLKWNRDNDNFEVLRKSDILISDFSGVIFDFSLVYDKPVIYTTPRIDLSPYDAWWLEGELWFKTALSRIGSVLNEESFNDIKNVIDTCIEDPKFAKGRCEVKSEAWAHFGESAVRTADYLINKQKELNDKGEKSI